MDSIELPQANRLEVLRRMVDAVGRGVVESRELAAVLRLSKRHLAYYRQAARILSWISSTEPPVVTTIGRLLTLTAVGSVAEASLMEHSVRAAPAIRRVAPDLFDAHGPTEGKLAARIHQAFDLAPSTALRRAQTLLAWRERILDHKVSLFQGASMPEVKDYSSPGPEKAARSEARALTSLRLLNFKNFKDAVVPLGPLTLITGTNASGKSNIRDAFRFLHGVSRGYTIAEIIGEKWVEGGVLQWKGLRGGTREAAFKGERTFAVEAAFQVSDRGKARTASYRIEVAVGNDATPPRVIGEHLIIEGRGQFVFDSHPPTNPPSQDDSLHLAVRLRKEGAKGFLGPVVNVISNRPALSQLSEHPDVRLPAVREHVRLALAAFQSMRFLDLSPDQMRLPSLPGQTVLSDRGENLSSVLQAICQNPNRKAALIEWVRELTPLDATDFEFTPDQTGKVLVTLVEEDGHRTSAYSASDGTLRFLAMIAALLGPEPARFYFLEELENGIHPTRLHLLLRLIERQAGAGNVQVVATTHSPQLLTALSSDAKKAAVLVYRLPGQAEATAQRILDIPEAARVLKNDELGKLLATGCLEDAVLFAQGRRDK